ncbi:hypothetical protein CP97_13355 [Aurantiacibacter atlanticus]|uniref:Uncharacterized protein n=1 Tax=Aurantiacibacter atlanticus TaxID=1648404 RepID=A0A0H4VIN5_9SPHN|nr:hypothetical protein [Aurantiacibacter atlanticus]AKQ42804.1 hypothetical protein CP97_13355 [Aurantiacibacter atlanticus]
MWVFAKAHYVGCAWAYLLSAFAGTAALSWLFFAHVERAMTRWLNIWLGVTHHGDILSQQSGV